MEKKNFYGQVRHKLSCLARMTRGTRNTVTTVRHEGGSMTFWGYFAGTGALHKMDGIKDL